MGGYFNQNTLIDRNLSGHATPSLIERGTSLRSTVIDLFKKFAL